MTGAEQGFLLLTSHLGDPDCKVLTVAQLRTLSRRVQSMEAPTQLRELTEYDLIALGYDRETAGRILQLLSRQEQLARYLYKAQERGCQPITRISPQYPAALRKRLGVDCPAVLWAKGDLSLLEQNAVAMVGSRELKAENLAFAMEAGRQAARQAHVLISGNARGADRVAQESCLAHGGKVISVVADSLEDQPAAKNILYLSEDGFDLPFSPQRALSRNRVIHCLGKLTLVAQCTLEKGGTWNGTVQNLRHDWTPVFCYADGSEAAMALHSRGAQLVQQHQLTRFSTLTPASIKFL